MTCLWSSSYFVAQNHDHRIPQIFPINVWVCLFTWHFSVWENLSLECLRKVPTSITGNIRPAWDWKYKNQRALSVCLKVIWGWRQRATLSHREAEEVAWRQDAPASREVWRKLQIFPLTWKTKFGSIHVTRTTQGTASLTAQEKPPRSGGNCRAAQMTTLDRSAARATRLGLSSVLPSHASSWLFGSLFFKIHPLTRATAQAEAGRRANR